MNRILPRLLVLLATVSFLPAQTGEVAPPENLIVQGVPPIPAALGDDVRRYTDFRSATFASWSPTRREMLIRTRFADTFQIHRVLAPGAARTQLTFFPDTARGGLIQPVAGASFLFLKDRGGDEFYQLYRYDFSDGRITLLTDGKSRNTGAVWSHDGKRAAYGSTRRTGNDVDLYVVEPADPASDRRIAELSGGGWAVDDWSPDGRKLLVTEEISANETYLWLFDASTGEKSLVTPKGGKEKVAYGNAIFRKDGKGLYVTTDRDSEFQRLALLDLDGKHLEFVTPDASDVDEIALSPDGRTVAYVTNEKGASALHLLDAESRREKPAPRLPAGVVSGIKWHPDGGAIAFDLDSARAPSDVYSLDVASGRADRWTFSETGGVNTEAFPEPELVSWKTFDNREITGFLYRPASKFTGKRPLLVQIHGGPEGQSRPGFLGHWNYFLNELGVAILYPNIRGSSGYGKTYLKLDNGFLREGAYRDIGALFDWVRGRPDLDADRVMVLGGSYGGHMTLAVSYLYSDRIRCSVDIVGISNLVSFLEHTSGYRRDLRRVEYGDERDPKMRAFLEKIAPMTNAERIRKPLFVVQGANDPRVPRSESEQMVERIRKVGTPVWYLLAKDEGHGFAKKSNRDFQFEATVLFARRFLLE